MNREEQKALIREVLEEMRKEGAALPRGLYAEAAARCDAYADGLLRKGQSYALHRVCAQAARGLYRDKHAIGGGRVPAQYIADQEAAEEYFFKLPPSDFDAMIECSEEESSTIKFIRRLRTANLKLYKS